MADNLLRYRIEEFQDSDGNIIYPQTDARGVWVEDWALYALLNQDITEEQIDKIVKN